MESCKCIQSEKGNKKLVDKENYVYQKHENDEGSKIYWRCERRSCKARLHSDVSFHALKYIGNHNHSTTAAEVSAKVATANIKERTITSQTPSRSILTEELGNLNECAIADVTKLAYLL